VDQLQERYPKLFLLDEKDADATGKEAADALSKDPALQRVLDDRLASLGEGQEEILHLLAKNDETLQKIGKAIDRGFKESQQANQDSYARILAELQAIRVERPASNPATAPRLSLADISRQVQAYESDAMRWLESDPEISAERVRQARTLVTEGLERAPQNTELIDLFGYLEKIQAQVEFEFGNQPAAVRALGEAAKYFTQALQKDPEDVSAMNGMSNVYYYGGNLDRAALLGRAVFKQNDRYGAAASDLAQYLEEIISRDGSSTDLLKELRTVYQRLEKLMLDEPTLFAADRFAEVQQRMAELDQALKDS
jgi:tetratricopeptide (TPR) repeat protein